MNGYTAFLKKELCESVRTYRLWIMLVIFLVFGIMSPLLALLTPDLIANFMPNGMSMPIPEPTAFDSWSQFYKNIGQLGLAVMIILFSGILSGEFSRGTLINMLSKGLSRKAVILSKFIAAIIIWTISYLLSFTATAGYTMYYWTADFSKELWLGILGLWLFGILLLSAVILGSTIAKSSYSGILFAGIITALFFMINLFPSWSKYNPLAAASMGTGLLAGEVSLTQVYWPMALCALLTLAFIGLSLILFQKKQIV